MTEQPNRIQPETNTPVIDLAAGRRAFIKTLGIGGTAAAIFGGLGAKAAAPTNLVDLDIVTFALNLEYLEAEYYLNAATGKGLASTEIDGKGGAGKVTGGRKVKFSNPIVSDYCQEIAADEHNHVKLLRSVLGNQVIGRPAIDIGSAFTTAAQAAGVIGAGQTFDPYADDVSFLLGAYIFEDVGVTAYSGAAPFISDKGILAAAAGILAVEAYHAGLVRTFLFAQQSSFVTEATAQISNLRASLSGNGVNDDQGIGADQSTLGGGSKTPSNIIPTDANSVAYARTPREVANIVFGAKGASSGLFFPAGLTGDLNPLFKV
jgi:ferritin-like protein